MATAPTIRLTEEQQAAVTTRRVSVGLSAGAGCGKTSVLTERFLSHLDPRRGEPARLAELVAITFTDKAAREMRDRIRRACQLRQISASTDEEADYWLGIVRQLQRARISTIHAFCASLLRRHAVEAGLDPQFAILEPAQATTLLNELIDDHLRQRLSIQDPHVIDLAFEYGLGTLDEMLRAILHKRHDIEFEKWRHTTTDELVARWRRLNEEQVIPAVIDSLFSSPAMREVRDLLRVYPRTIAKLRARCERLEELIPQIRPGRDLIDVLNEAHETAKVQGVVTKKDFADASLYERFRDGWKAFRSAVSAVLEDVRFDDATSRHAAEAGLKLLTAAAPVVEAYEARKRELGFLDFDDLLIRARDLVFAPEHVELRRRLSDGVAMLLVDECQDTDPLQMSLVEALCGDAELRAKLFFVGDFKQSIYRFRGADPTVFHDLLSRTSEEGRLQLTENFRSQPAILTFVNALFADSFRGYHALRPTRPQLSPEPAVEFLWASQPAGEVGKENVTDERRREARWIARRLRQMLESGERLVFVPGEDGTPPTTRAARSGDVAILLRAMSDVQFYEEALRAEGIDYYVVGGRAFYAQQEVYDVVNLLRALESPADDVSLAGALRSPLFSLSDETLFWLAQHPGGLNEGLSAAKLPSQLDRSQRGRAERAAEIISSLRSLKNRLSIAELLDEALGRTGYDATLLGEFLGERKLANLRKLVEQARSFDAAGAFTLADFIAQLVEFVSTQPDEAVAATHAEDSNVVRLMSIHQSKGLEFPIVVVADLERPKMHSKESATFDEAWGPLVRRPQTAPDGAMGGLELYRVVEATADDDERLRLLYVATTRAADYLLLSSNVKDLASPRESWLRLLAARFDLATGECRAELHEADTPRIRVTLTEPEVGPPPSATRSANLSKVFEEARSLAQRGPVDQLTRIDPIEPDLAARRRFSFSQLSGRLHVEQVRRDPDDEATEQGIDARGLGSFVHELLAENDGAIDDERFRAIGERHEVTDPAAVALAREMMTRFATSGRAKAIAAAKSIHRELEFLLAWPSAAVPESSYVIHGFIDCVYRDSAGRWHVVDYKTNQVAAGRVEEVARHYELQLLIYALAIERAVGAPPATLGLHFLREGQEFAFAWDDAARARLNQLMTAALAEAQTSREPREPAPT